MHELYANIVCSVVFDFLTNLYTYYGKGTNTTTFYFMVNNVLLRTRHMRRARCNKIITFTVAHVRMYVTLHHVVLPIYLSVALTTYKIICNTAVSILCYGLMLNAIEVHCNVLPTV